MAVILKLPIRKDPSTEILKNSPPPDSYLSKYLVVTDILVDLLKQIERTQAVINAYKAEMEQARCE